MFIKNNLVIVLVVVVNLMFSSVFFSSCIMDNNAMYAAQHAQLGKIYGGLDPTCR